MKRAVKDLWPRSRSAGAFEGKGPTSRRSATGEPDSVWAKTLHEVKRLWSDEEGAVFVLLVVIFLGLAVFAFGVAGIGEAVRQKIEMQNAVDAAAYSGAVIQADVFSACAQLNQAIAWHYASLLSSTIEYINAKWLISARRNAWETWEMVRAGARCGYCGAIIGNYRWRMTTPFQRSTVTWTNPDQFEGALRQDLGIAGLVPLIETEAELVNRMTAALYGETNGWINIGPWTKWRRYGIQGAREAIVELCSAERLLKENSAKMVRAEVHDVLRKNLDLPSKSESGRGRDCFFACDLDPGEDGEIWFEPITLQGGVEDAAWKYITGEYKYWNARFLTDPGESDASVKWALGLSDPQNPDYWLRTFGDNFPGRYNSSDSLSQESPDNHWYLRAHIEGEYQRAHYRITRYGHDHWHDIGYTPITPRDIKGSGGWDAYFNLKEYFQDGTDRAFTWYRRGRDFFKRGSINVGIVRKMKNLLGVLDDGSGTSLFRVFDPSFWIGDGKSRFMMTVASSRAGYKDGEGEGLYNPTADADYDPPLEVENSWQEAGWAIKAGLSGLTSHNGFTLDWDAILMPVNRARSWRVPGIGEGRDGEWEDEQGKGSGHEMFERLLAGKWYATDAAVSFDEEDLAPVDELAGIPGIAAGFPPAPGWTEAGMKSLPQPDAANAPGSLEAWPGQLPSESVDFGNAEEVFKLLRH